jgi:hypothetical protein
MKTASIKVGVREFRERIASFLESDVPVAVTRHGETVGIYVPMEKRTRTAGTGELKQAADRLAEALRDVDEEELVEDFKRFRRRPKKVARASSSL